MLERYHLYHVFLLALWTTLAGGQSLLAALEANGFGKFANQLQDSPVATAGPGLIVYAPTDAALAYSVNNGTVARRDDASDAIRRSRAAVCAVNATAYVPSIPFKRRSARDASVPAGETYMTLLSDPEFVNLGPGRNQTLVQSNVVGSSLPVVFSGLGASVKVTGDDIPYDNGVIRPINGVITLPLSVSKTLPFLGAETFQRKVEEAGLTVELDNQASITVLVPDDNAFVNASTSRAELAEVIKQHVIVGFTAYTPHLKHGGVYPTLAGGQVTVVVQEDGVYIDGARLLAGDAIVANGVIHTIDKVLSPSSSSPPPIAAMAGTARPRSWAVWTCSFLGLAVAVGYTGFL